MENKEFSQEFLERKTLLALEKEIVEIRHSFKLEEIRLQREISQAEHVERVSEIKLKTESIQKGIEDRERKLKDSQERRSQHFQQEQHGRY